MRRAAASAFGEGGSVLEGQGLLALWNGVDPTRAAEYDLWHTREHVPERVGVPGMLSARRYIDGDGPLPHYLTLYDLQSLEVLSSAPYRALLDKPTEWSSSMRPSFRGFLRLACRPIAQSGGGLGGALMATTLGLNDSIDLTSATAGLSGLLRDALAIPAVTAARIAVVATDVPSVPFTVGGEMPDYPRDAVLMLESYDRGALAKATGAVEEWFRRSRLGAARTAWTSYALGYVLRHAELPQVVAAGQPGGQGV